MKKWMVLVCVLLLTGFWTGVGLAASDEETHDVSITVTEVAELGIAGGTEVSFVVEADTDPGAAFKVTETNPDAKYLQYTSIVADSATRKITVIQTDTLPPGVTLKVTPAPPGATNGKGTLGMAQSAITLNEAGTGSAKDVVTGIGSCYTGTGVTDGVKLTYELTVEEGNVADLKTQTAIDYTVTYTLTAGTS